MILFGITMSAFLSAVAMVESDNGLTSDNVYQLEEVYIRDVERISGLRFSVDAKYNRAASETIMCIYLSHYGKVYERKTGNKATYEVLARIHNGGPDGWKKKSTERYWEKVKSHLYRMEAK